MSFVCPAFKNTNNIEDRKLFYSTTDPERDQLYIYKYTHKGNNDVARDREGHKVPSVTTIQTIGPNGPPILYDFFHVKATQSFNRQIIPIRIVHGKGFGVHGIFEVTHDITKYTRAKVFSPGTVTEVFGRFSSNDFPGQPDTSNNQAHTMCMKFYTEQGNLDILTLNIPVFDVKDPLNFLPIHTRSVQFNPQTGVTVDPNSLWDFVSLRNERLHMVVRAHSGQGFPKTFRHMDTFAVSIFHFENDEGQLVYGRFHFKTNQGVQNYTKKQSDKLAEIDPHIQIRDLYNAISKKVYPSFTVCFQIMTEEQRIVYESQTGLDTFDNTKIWPEKKFPLKIIGKLTYNRLPESHFNETEQFAVDPANLVPGIKIPPQERILQGRSFVYNDAQIHRIGPNHAMLPINRPRGLKDPLRSYFRDGPMNYDTVQNGAPSYYPNSFDGPKLVPDLPLRPSQRLEINGEVGRYDLGEDGTHYVQVIEYLNEMIPPAERKRTADNIGDSLKPLEPFIRDKIITIFRDKIDPSFADMIENRLNGERNSDEEDDSIPYPDDVAMIGSVEFEGFGYESNENEEDEDDIRAFGCSESEYVTNTYIKTAKVVGSDGRED